MGEKAARPFVVRSSARADHGGMPNVASGCVLVQLTPAGWVVRIVDGPCVGGRGAPAWLPIGLDAASPASAALERARALFPGRLVALFTP